MLSDTQGKLSHPSFESAMRTIHSSRFYRSSHARRKKRDMNVKLGASINRLKVEMKEISKDQHRIKKDQKQMRDTFEKIRSDYDILREESKLIAQKSNITKTRIFLIVEILRARQNKEFDGAYALASSLRTISKCL